MSKNIEIEIRADLSEEEYNLILSSYKNEKSYSQTNYYLDDSNLSFSSENYGLRIREKNEKFELTLKEKINDDFLEINQEISSETKENMANPGYFPSGEVANYISNKNLIDTKKLFIVCSLKTTRLDIKYNGSTISLDKNEYCGIKDFNIECEADTNKDVENILKSFLSKYKIKLKKSPYTKLQKALLKIK